MIPEDTRGQGFEGSSEMLKNYKDLKILKKVYWVGKKDILESERMLKTLIKSLDNKHLNPWPLESLDPLLQLKWRRTKNNSIALAEIANRQGVVALPFSMGIQDIYMDLKKVDLYNV